MTSTFITGKETAIMLSLSFIIMVTSGHIRDSMTKIVSLNNSQLYNYQRIRRPNSSISFPRIKQEINLALFFSQVMQRVLLCYIKMQHVLAFALQMFNTSNICCFIVYYRCGDFELLFDFCWEKKSAMHINAVYGIILVT